mgnify:CR=1 FL=1
MVTSNEDVKVYEIDMNEVDKVLGSAHGNIWKGVINFYLSKVLE